MALATNESIMLRNCCCDRAVAAAKPAANCEATVLACKAAAMLGLAKANWLAAWSGEILVLEFKGGAAAAVAKVEAGKATGAVAALGTDKLRFFNCPSKLPRACWKEAKLF